MKRTNRLLSIAISLLGLVAIVVGAVFLFEGVSKNNLIANRMEIEKVTLAVDPANPDQVTQINNSAEAQKAADLIAQHRRSIAPTYQELLGGGKFDPTNTKELTYAQAMNLENYLYLAVTAFGLVQVVLATGAFMIIVGIALGLIGIALYRVPAKQTA
jgi:hypothetical protein